MKRLLAEFAGTFLLVLLGCGSMVIGEQRPDLFNNFSIALVFGLAVFTSIVLFGRISGSHINPAVTLFLILKGKIKLNESAGYLIAQFAGATFAAAVLMWSFPSSENLGSTLPHAGITNSWGIEFFATALLLILVSKSSIWKIYKTAAVIGVLIFLEAYFFGPMTGASMNPARSFGPMVLSNNMGEFWLYLTAHLTAIGFVTVLQAYGPRRANES